MSCNDCGCGGNCSGCGSKNSNIPVGTALTGDMIYDGPTTTVNGVTITSGDRLNNVLVNIMNSRASFEMVSYDSGTVIFSGEGGGEEVVKTFTFPSAGNYLVLATLNFSGVAQNDDILALIDVALEDNANDKNGYPIIADSLDNSKSIHAVMEVSAANLTKEFGLYLDAGSNNHDYQWTLGVYKL